MAGGHNCVQRGHSDVKTGTILIIEVKRSYGRALEQRPGGAGGRVAIRSSRLDAVDLSVAVRSARSEVLWLANCCLARLGRSLSAQIWSCGGRAWEAVRRRSRGEPRAFSRAFSGQPGVLGSRPGARAHRRARLAIIYEGTAEAGPIQGVDGDPQLTRCGALSREKEWFVSQVAVNAPAVLVTATPQHLEEGARRNSP